MLASRPSLTLFAFLDRLDVVRHSLRGCKVVGHSLRVLLLQRCKVVGHSPFAVSTFLLIRFASRPGANSRFDLRYNMCYNIQSDPPHHIPNPNVEPPGSDSVIISFYTMATVTMTTMTMLMKLSPSPTFTLIFTLPLTTSFRHSPCRSGTHSLFQFLVHIPSKFHCHLSSHSQSQSGSHSHLHIHFQFHFHSHSPSLAFTCSRSRTHLHLPFHVHVQSQSHSQSEATSQHDLTHNM